MQSSAAIGSDVSLKQEKRVSSDLIPPGGTSLIYDFPACAKWLFGSIIFLAIPLYRRILRMEGELEEEGVDVVETVKHVAEVTRKVSFDLAEALPADSSLKKLVMKVEAEAEVVYLDSEKAEAFIHKVDEAEAWLKKIADEWELIMPEEGIHPEKKSNQHGGE